MDNSETALAVVLLFFLAFVNGGNDVSKGIATLAGAGLTSVRGALAWGTLWTVAGALAGLYWGAALIKNISESIYVEGHEFQTSLALAISLAPIVWIALATWRKWPVSTTHAIVGSLVGAGLMAYGASGIDWLTILSKIALPLLVSPIAAIGLAWFLTPALERAAQVVNRARLCLTPVPKLALIGSSLLSKANPPIDDGLVCVCDSPQAGLIHGLTLPIDRLHWLTSGVLSFARGLNDMPKLIAIILPFLMQNNFVAPPGLFILGALAMGAGSWVAGRSITEVLGFKLTKLNHEQGFSANLVSAFLVIAASRFGLPVSTTHVSASSIMGVGVSKGKTLNMATVSGMLFAWLVTAPAAALIAATILAFLAAYA